MHLGLAVVLGVGAYLIGAVSLARIVAGRVIPEEDISSTTLELIGGSTIHYGGVSATAVGARTGPKWGLVVGLGDMLKAFIPVLVVRLAWPNDAYHLVVAVMVIVGHNWPVYHRFQGGRGQSPLYGGLFAVDPLAGPATAVLGMAIGLGVMRDMFAAYTLGQFLLIPWFFWLGTGPEAMYAVLVNVLFLVATIPEMREYFRKRRAGELTQVSSWREFKSSHPAMGSGRDEAQE